MLLRSIDMNIMIMNIIKFNHDDGNYVVSLKKM